MGEEAIVARKKCRGGKSFYYVVKTVGYLPDITVSLCFCQHGAEGANPLEQRLCLIPPLLCPRQKVHQGTTELS